MVKDIADDAKSRMGKSVKSFRSDLTRLRTGRAHPSLLEHVTVDYYGTRTPITQTAKFAVEDARTLTVTAWDKTMVDAIEKAILESDLGLNPATAGMVIRIPLPALTEERRKELIKVIKHEAEQAKVAVRNIRRDAISHMKDLVKEKEISKDDEHRGEDVVQKLTDEHVAEIDEIVAGKEKETLEI
ncbi:MAG: ribosome recycling factor [Pseudomonadota bacterium]|nr:ribosome recycling factor [Pseudomonadota bacterium]